MKARRAQDSACHFSGKDREPDGSLMGQGVVSNLRVGPDTVEESSGLE